jgi:predicted alpha/beta-fold hydrolase
MGNGSSPLPGALAPPVEFPPFVPARWLRNAHVQTVVASRRPRRFRYGWTSWEEIEIDLGPEGRLMAEASWQPGPRAAAPALILMHGLEGSARSHYLVGMSKKAYAAGFHAIRINTRNCGGTEHLTPTFYCAALSQDVGAIVRHLGQHHDVRAVYGAGVSLGANILLKYLGEQGPHSQVLGLAVVSPPIDLARGVRKLEEPANWFYHRYFVRRLIDRVRRKVALFPGIADLDRVERVRSIWEFDDVVTAPHFGFGTAANYYRLASSGPLLRDVAVPTLIVQAKDDPMIPFDSFSRFGIADNPAIRLLATERGGHTGFLAAKPGQPDDLDSYWGECRVVQFLSDLARRHGLAPLHRGPGPAAAPP